MLCSRWGRVNGIKCSPANTALVGQTPAWLLLLLEAEERCQSFSKDWSYWIIQTNVRVVMLTIHLTWLTSAFRRLIKLFFWSRPVAEFIIQQNNLKYASLVAWLLFC